MRKIKTFKKDRVKKLLQLQLLQLEKLERVVGGKGDGPIVCPDCNDKRR